MKAWNRCIASLLILFFLVFNVPNPAIGESSLLSEKVDEKDITRHELQVRSTPMKDIPPKKVNKWVWVVLGGLAIAAAALALADGGGGGDGNTETVNVTW